MNPDNREQSRGMTYLRMYTSADRLRNVRALIAAVRYDSARVCERSRMFFSIFNARTRPNLRCQRFTRACSRTAVLFF